MIEIRIGRTAIIVLALVVLLLHEPPRRRERASNAPEQPRSPYRVEPDGTDTRQLDKRRN